MWVGARRSVCALGISVALTAGVVSVAPAPTPQVAAGQVYVSDVVLAAASSPAASSAVVDLEVLRDRIDRAIRTGLYILSLPVTFPISMLGLIEGYGCIYSGCEPRLLNLSVQFGNFFRPPGGDPRGQRRVGAV